MAPMKKFKKFLNCHNSGCTQDRVVIFDSRVGFSGTAYLMASFKFTPGLPLPVAKATIFGTKSAVTGLVQEISLTRLRLTGGFRGRAIE